ncbi:polysaccharide biosynthesis protein [mine drainage metagenome]|uniref:Polysaccharide biosynthesis protein n=1 Tax=mine drainage metagenome TaxID=410659 RepID=A0A1J5RPP8_9ZZZZ
MIHKFTGSIWALLEYLCYPLIIFVATPYLLHTLGAENYGYWMLLNAIVSLGVVLNVGTSAATIKLISAGIGKQNNGDITHIVNSSLTIAIFGGGLLALIISIVFSLMGTGLFEKMSNHSLLLLTGLTAALLAWIEQIDNVFTSTIKGSEKFGLAAKIEIISKTLQILVAVLVVGFSGSMAAFYFSFVIVAVCRLFIKYLVVKKYLNISNFKLGLNGVRETLIYAKWGWLQGLGSLLFGVADRFLVGSIMGATALTYYSVATQLAQQIHAISSAGLSVIFPKISRKIEGASSFSLRKIAHLAIMGNFFISSVLAISLFIFGHDILLIWLGTSIASTSSEILFYLTIGYWLLAMNVAPHFILLAIGRMKFVALSNVVAGIVSLTIMFILIGSNGLVGVGVARILYGIITLVNFLSLFDYLKKRNEKYIE